MDDLVESGREIIERGSKSFAVAARLFDRETRAGAYLLYAWCRHCDDETDAQKLGWGAEKLAPEVVRARVAKIREQTARALAGEPVAEAVFRGLRQVVERYGIPRRYVFEHLAGFEMDAVGHEYRQLEDTLLYSYHVAGVVGIMMSHVMGADDEPTLDRAADLGIAFQLTNIARDVLDDVATGRVYLPADWLVQAGVPAAAVQAPRHRPAVFALAKRLLGEAERYYRSSRVGISRLPLRSAWAVATATAVYRDIGRVLVRQGPRAWEERPATSPARKVVLALRGAVTAVASRLSRHDPWSEPRDGLWQRPSPFAEAPNRFGSPY